MKQPRYRARELAVETATQAGKLVAFPGQFMFAADRQAQAARAADQAAYDAGGLVRNPALLIASAVLSALPPANQAAALAFLQFMGGIEGEAGAQARAAELWSRRMVDGGAAIRAAGDGERQGWRE